MCKKWHTCGRERAGEYRSVPVPWRFVPYPEGWLLSLSVAASVLALNAVFLAAFTGGTRHLHRFLIPHYVIALLGIATGAVSAILPGIALLGILTILGVAQIFFSMREMPSEDAD